MRRLQNLVAFCAAYEFEDVLASVTDADRIEPANPAALELSRRTYKYLRLITRSPALAMRLTPAAGARMADRRYDLFLPVFHHPHELHALASVPDWRQRCRLGACFIVELWSHQLPRYLLELLAKFDHIFVASRLVVNDVARITGRPCSYLPLAADVLTFAPHPQWPERSIDVCNLGRRSAATHDALIGMARERRLVYYYDTAAASGVDQRQRTFRVQNPSEHRLLLASVLQRSRYYIANRARINEPDFVSRGDEISGRFYEGAATGAVMIGEPPRAEEFSRQFDWPDAVIPMPFDRPDIAAFLATLDGDPRRLARIRRDNVRHAALRHDWVHRLRAIFEALGLTPTARMLERERRLAALACDVPCTTC